MNRLVRDLCAAGVLTNKNVRNAFHEVDRKDFVPAALRDCAYENRPLDIGDDQTISQPYTVAFMLDLLAPKNGETIMDIGHGSGWTTALLAHCVGEQGRVCAVEIIPKLCAFGKKNVAKYPELLRRVEFYCGDARDVVPKKIPNAILVSAALPIQKNSIESIPALWRTYLAKGGRIVAPIEQSIWLFVKRDNEVFEAHEYPGFVFVPFVEKQAGI